MMRKSFNGDYPDAKILVIDDEEPNLRHARQVLQMAGYQSVSTLQDSRQAVDAIVNGGPDLVLLDVHMPHYDGYEVLAGISKRLPEDSFIPVLMCTSDNALDTRQRALKLGANDFIVKPYEPTEMLLRVRNFLRTRYLHLSEQQANAKLEHRVRQRTDELVESRSEAFVCLARALELRCDSDNGHMKRVARLSERIARSLGVDDEEVDFIGLVAPLYDLGKLCLKDAILEKTGPLTDAEETEMRRHTALGEAIIGNCNSPLLKEIKILSRHHHERWDGTGYPDGLEGKAIPLACRIIAVAEAYDLLITRRTDGPPMQRDDALAEVRRLSGSHFDPAVVDAFLKLYGR